MVREKLNPNQAAEYLGCSYGKLLEMARNKVLPHIRIGARVFFFKDSLDLWLENLERESVQ